MRRVQMSISMEIFPKDKNEKYENLEVYLDGQNMWEVVCAGFDELLCAIKERSGRIPSFGVREHKWK